MSSPGLNKINDHIFPKSVLNIVSQNVWDTKVLALQTLVRDNPAQVEKLKEIDALEKRWLIEAASVEIEKRRSVKESNKSLEYMQYVLRKEEGKKHFIKNANK